MIAPFCNLVVNQMRLNNILMHDMLLHPRQYGIYLQWKYMKNNLMSYILLFTCWGMHRLVFNANDDATSVLQIVKHKSTTLTAYFARCVIDANAR